VEVYYEQLFKLANCLYVKTTDVLFNLYFSNTFVTIFAFGNCKYEKGHFNKHKEVVVICEESGLVTISYNVILITPNINTTAKTIVTIISTKSLLICINF
jgi:hypothetical protein